MEDKELMKVILESAQKIADSTDRSFEMDIIHNNDQATFSKKKSDVLTITFTLRN